MRLFGFPRDTHRSDLADVYADEQLRGVELERYEAHLRECERCHELVAEARTVRTAVASLPQLAAPRSFAITPEMAAAARPARLRAATPIYLNFARAGAALSVAAFGTVAAMSALDSSASDDSSSDFEKGGSVSLTSAEAPETNDAAYDSGTGASPPEAQASPQLAPATNAAGVSGSSGTVAPVGSATPVPPATGRDESATPTMPAPQPPMTGPGGVTNETDLGGETNDDDALSDRSSTDTSFSPLPDALTAPDDDSGGDGLLVALGALAGVAVLGLGILEVARRRNA